MNIPTFPLDALVIARQTKRQDVECRFVVYKWVLQAKIAGEFKFLLWCLRSMHSQ